jgi:tRNA-2-methylthio-N6-dimethylallyladenosine synthase
MKTFYIETFGCQMNAHDSEKVIGTLVTRGYEQVETPEDAELVLYNTCSIRDKAEQKVFNRLQNFKRAAGKGKVFGVLGCVAQQEGEKIFDRAPHVSLVVGSASYNQLPQLLVQIENGEKRVTGLSLDTEDTFETPLTRRDNPHRAFLTIIEGCNKACSYCVVPFTRGPERSRTGESVLAEARQLVAAGYLEIMLLGQNVNSFRVHLQQGGTSLLCWKNWPLFPAYGACASPRPIPGISPKRSSTRSTPIRFSATTSICQCRADPPKCSPKCSACTRAINTCGALSG